MWKGGGDQLFSVNFVYSLVRRDCEADLSPIFRKLWSCKVVPSTLFTAWRVMENKIVTRVNLERRGVMLESYLCGKEEESYRHLFFDCFFAWRVWCFCFKWLGVSFVYHNDPKSNFAHFRMNTSSDLISEVWNTIWVGVVGEIWNHINSVIFNRGVTDASEVCTLMQAKVWSWISAKSSTTSVSFSSWCLEPLECMRLVI